MPGVTCAARAMDSSKPGYAPRVDVELRASIPGGTLAGIRSFVAGQNCLHDVVVAGLASEPQRGVCNVVVQDEYTHDVVVKWSDGVYLVYDTT